MAFTGAGLSTESGLPDFRGEGGLWERHRPVPYDDFLRSEDARREYWGQRLELYAAQLAAVPNAGHRAIAELHARGRLHALVTQNIDGLHEAAGHPPERTAELHGTNTRTRCLACGTIEPASRTYERLLDGEEVPACPACGGIQKPDTISFGQPLDPGVLDRAVRWTRECDAILAVGSTLTVEPAASLPRAAASAGAALLIVNDSPTALDDVATLVVRGRAGPTLAAAVAALGGPARDAGPSAPARPRAGGGSPGPFQGA